MNGLEFCSKEELSTFAEITRKYLARTLVMVGKGDTLDTFQRTFLPQGKILFGLDGEVLQFDPDPCEYPSPAKGGEKALRLSRMTPSQRYKHCLTMPHILDMYPGVDMKALLEYSKVSTALFNDAFDPRIESWIDEITAQEDYQEIE